MKHIAKSFVKKELRQLKSNKATGLDDLPPRLLKECSESISQPLSYIMNLSINCSVVPNLWKSTKVVPIFKSRNHELPENYRPISVLPVLSQILEKIVHQQLLEYLEDNKLLSESQYGF